MYVCKILSQIKMQKLSSQKLLVLQYNILTCAVGPIADAIKAIRQLQWGVTVQRVREGAMGGIYHSY
mgnify:CR=1 FL=1